MALEYSGNHYHFLDRTEEENVSHNPLPQDGANSKKLGLLTYKEVWQEFYRWEPQNCRQIIDALAGSCVVSTETREMFEELLTRTIAHVPDGAGRVISHSSQFEITTDVFEPHPKYEACAPINHSIARSQQLEDTLQFVPYADDSRFPAAHYVAEFEGEGGLAWEEDFDPDLEEIQLETARRLYHNHDISLGDIDRIGILEHLRPYNFNNTGLLWGKSQRDALKWPGALIDQGELPTSYVPMADDLHGRHTSALKSFCPICMQSQCALHPGPHASTYGGGLPKVTGESMRLSEGLPCGDECFRLVTNDTFADTVHWDDTGMETLSTILKIAPDVFPCQLAVLCLKPCREAFVQRCNLFPDHVFLDDEDEGAANSRRGVAQQTFHDSGGKHITRKPAAPCDHKGLCDYHNCSCYRERVHCQQRCRCGPKCERQRPGCSCRPAKHTKKSCCSTKACPCYEASVECHPDVCFSCDARSMKGYCRNNRIQRGDSKALEIKAGRYGLGAFAVEKIRPGDLVGDYVGFLMTQDMVHQHDPERHHNGLNYLFDVRGDNEEVLDAAYAGNATRYLNDAKDEDGTNCDARPMLVNNHHHMALYATERIARGQELFLNYGEKYWLSHT
ncbi:SET domain-containing protein [Leucogyrophana mollusca]|uniref:SET domain-containing protein n=1 Tax=Leucogyrophana mollusca TaxID=85980 RepID=A0ACB8B652_9AGAM|nr:SET domain-containing protein [Leucogyrophana mollusca]